MFILTVFLLVNTMLAQNQGVTRAMDPISTFLAAADSGDTAKVAGSIKQGIEINVTDEQGYTALMRAVNHTSYPPPLPPSLKGTKAQKERDKRYQRKAEIMLMMVKTLVMRGADLDLRDEDGRTALEIARMNHHTRILEFLKSK